MRRLVVDPGVVLLAFVRDSMRRFAKFPATSLFVLVLASPAYAGVIPTGVQNDVLVDTVLNDWGWEVIYRGDYSAGGFGTPGVLTIGEVLNGVGPGDHIMLAGIQDGSTTFDVLAAALFEEVTTVTSSSATHVANGAEWYYNSLSMGFAGLGDSITQFSADTTGQTERDRLSWHTNADAGRGGGSAPDYVWGGWRSGSNVGLNSSTNFDMVVLKLTAVAVPEPDTLSLVVLGLAGLGLGLGRRTSIPSPEPQEFLRVHRLRAYGPARPLPQGELETSGVSDVDPRR